MAQTVDTVRPLAMIAFEKAMYNQWNRCVEVVTALSQHGSDEMDTEMLTQRFSIPATTGAPTRGYGDTLPSEFANCDDAPTYAYAEVDLVWQVAPARIRYDLLQLKNGFMGNPVQHTLDNLNRDVKFEAERWTAGGIGDAVLFNLNGAGTDNLDGTFTYPVANYGGRAGQVLGQLMEALLLEGTPIQAADAVGNAPGNASGDIRIVSVVATPGSETITTDGDLAGGGATAAGWVVYRSRTDAGGVQTLGDAHRGLPYIVSDWTDFATFQGVTQADAPRFQAKVIRSPGAPLAINEQLFNRMLSLGEVALPCDPDGKGPVMNGFFLLHTFNVNAFALSLTQDRRFMTPPLRNAGAAGYAKKYLSFCDIPVVGAHMAQRNSAYYLIADRLFWRKNGPLWGQFMTIGGQTRFAIPCSPDQEVRWVSCRQLAAHGRAGMVRADNLEEALPDAA